MHECHKEEIINNLVTAIELLKQNDEVQVQMLKDTNNKLDKIIWYLLGITTAICTSLIIYLV